MSVATLLSTDLQTLIAESRRRSPEIKHRSLATLKSQKPASLQEEVTFIREISQSSDFITPFLLSCSSRNAKFSTIAIQSLQRLIQIRAVPISRLDMLLEALTEATRLAVDIQLKVLQILPTLFQIYAEFIGGPLLAKLLLICAMLQQPSKLPMVVNTAAATQQQLVLALFEKVIDEDKSTSVDREEFEVSIDDDEKIKVPTSAYDAYNVFSDICSLIEHQKPSFLTFNVLSESFGLELLENIFTNYHNVFLSHPELGFLVRTRITPLLLRFFSNHKDFAIVVRVSRIILLLIKSQLSILEIEAEVILSLLTHVITSESNLPQWKKALSLEIFSAIFTDFDLTKVIFEVYDFATDKKKIITEFFTVCSDVIHESWAQNLLRMNDIVSIPPTDDCISTNNSSIRIPLVDILDKQEPPPIPKTYTLFLILGCTNSLCDGIGKFALEMSRAEDNTFKFITDEDESKHADVSLLKSIITTNAKSLVTIGSEYLYASVGSELFHTLIRALQKLCHASGVLGLVRERDSLLMLFSIATVSNVSKKPQQNERPSISGTFADAFSSTPSTPIKKNFFQERSLNARHVICFRALVSLTTSLGPILGHSWRFVLITFQWFSYFINGPAEYFSFKEIPEKPQLTPQDVTVIEQSLLKFGESTKSYDTPAYRLFVSELIALSTEAVHEDKVSAEPIEDDDFKICSFNKDFFLNKLDEYSKVNCVRYLEKENSADWSKISTFLSDVATSDNVIPELRVTACSVFNDIIMSVADTGFSSGGTTQKADLENMLFKSFSEVADKIIESHRGESFNSAESSIIHDTLKTLYELLNRYGPQFKNSWGSILYIIASPFKVLELFKHETSQKQLLKSAFEIMQLILNDFLQAIPLSSLKDVIDALENFCSQTFELNVSFSGVSYYWLISDHLRELASAEHDAKNFSVTSPEELMETIENTESTYIKVHALWLYLLRSLVHISNISRAEVKNGAVQTFFKIVDSHGSNLDWERAFPVVVKNLLSIDLEKPTSEAFDEMKAFVDSNSIILKGTTDLYCRFYITNKNTLYWEDLLECYKRFVALAVIPLSHITYKSLNQILGMLTDPSPEQRDLFFNFWCGQPIKYVAVDTDLYQDSLVELVGVFTRLHNFGPLTTQQLEQTLGIFNSMVRFPFLPKYSTDVLTPTKLQAAVLACIETIDISTDGDMVLSQISSMVLMPFQVRSRIIKKLQNVHKKDIPTYIAISKSSLELLESKLNVVKDFQSLVSNGTASRVIKNLLESVTGTIDDTEHYERILNSGIWMKSYEILFFIIEKVAPLLDAKELEDTDKKSALWSLIVDVVCTALPSNNLGRDEAFNTKYYIKFKEIILAKISQSTLSPELVTRFVAALWKSSMLYENNELETHLLELTLSPEETTKTMLEFKVEDYTTSPIHVLPQLEFRKLCLNDLFTFSKPDTNEKLLSATLPYLLCRVVLIIKKFAGSQRLLNRAPVPTVQQNELELLLTRLHELLQLMNKDNSKTYGPLLGVFPLILDNHQYIGKLRHTQGLLTGITAEFYKISSN
ncbi:Protein MON2 [Cyberlindnera fabianii]|uniref:Protein MON2 n=1 Tax=Cyberlindnera fabianii TaxID=36022 RepID=A0A1V2L0P1_CYBFA|nr:Protein MON2 [Cyberlindnera fabianii]